ncbi:SNF2-like protein [Bacillus phage PBC1]|uniref:SNF2-like protein n=1 Tax=Bacillus phage PBC1 TaxID=1161901 RepID=I1TLI4_9CAUD|nr:DNA helicase [Bacillus phage PBC1]AFE86286.1 SNF2-like protein [Bacillus phage PBC1]
MFDIDKTLVIAPLRVASDTWAREVDKWDHISHLTISKILGPAEKRLAALKEDADIYVINRENVPWLVQQMGKDWMFDTVVIDELSSFKNPSSKRFKALKRVRPHISRLIGLTGTPAPNGLLDLWSQIYLLDEGARLGKTIGGYKDRYFNAGKRNGHVVYEWKKKPSAEENIYAAIDDIVISMKAEDWLDMPPRIDRNYVISLDEDSKARYDQLERDLLLPMQGADIIAQTAAVLSMKLLQLSSGAIYDEERGIHFVHDAKLDALEDIYEAANGRPIMVFYNYKHSLERIQKRFPKARVLRKGKEGDKDIADWNNDKIDMFLLHPKSAGHGLNLQESSCTDVVWFDVTWSLEEDQQANARVHRQGQKNTVVIHKIVAEGTIDEDVVSAIGKKADTQDELMQAVKARIERVAT